MYHDNNTLTISIEQFVSQIMKCAKAERISDSITYGYQNCWLEDHDVISKTLALDKKTAARIIHQYLRYELKEPDEQDFSEAAKLLDLYDCRSCVNHIAQVYVKGIMEQYSDMNGRCIFGMNEKLSHEESIAIIERIFDPTKRNPKLNLTKPLRKADTLTKEQVLLTYLSDKKAIFIDVRSLAEYEHNHMKGARHIPLATILKNPYAVCEQRDRSLLLYCNEGYLSHVAAQCLLEAGYDKVISFAWES